MADKYNVLLADDDEDDRFLLKSVFDTYWPDCEVRFAVDGVELLETLGQSDRHPDLILLDLNMPRMDGFSALEHIRNSAFTRTIPVVMFTTSSAPDHIHRAYELGANSFVTKPSNYRELVSVLTDLRTSWLPGPRAIALPAQILSGGRRLLPTAAVPESPSTT